MEQPLACVPSAQLGKARRIDDAGGRYIEFCKSTFPTELDLKGWRIVVDCAHGAGYHVAPPVFHELGADVIAIGAEPNGININDGVGATHAKHLKAAVRRAQGRSRHRARRRRRPAADGRPRRPRLRRRPAALRDRDGLPAPQGADGRRGRHADDQPRPRAGARARGHRVRARRGRRPLRAGEAAGEAAGCSAARIPATSSASTSTRPATRSSPRSRCCARWSSSARRSPRPRPASRCFRSG